MDSSALSYLSKPLRESAILAPNGEVRWPIDCIVEAVNELADEGAVILGLDLWPDEDDSPTEIPLAAYDGGTAHADVEPARRRALEALRSVPEFEWTSPSILVTWARTD